MFETACELPFLNTDRTQYLDGVSIEYIIEFYEFNITYCGMIFPFLIRFGILLKKQIKAIFEDNQFDFLKSLLSNTNFNILISNLPNTTNNTFFHKLKNNNLPIDNLKNQLKQKNEIYKYSNLEQLFKLLNLGELIYIYQELNYSLQDKVIDILNNRQTGRINFFQYYFPIMKLFRNDCAHFEDVIYKNKCINTSYFIYLYSKYAHRSFEDAKNYILNQTNNVDFPAELVNLLDNLFNNPNSTLNLNSQKRQAFIKDLNNILNGIIFFLTTPINFKDLANLRLLDSIYFIHKMLGIEQNE